MRGYLAFVQRLVKKREMISSTWSCYAGAYSVQETKREFILSFADEVDVIGYTSNQSDTDDHSSVQSSSDSGVAMSTSRLTLSEMMDNL